MRDLILQLSKSSIYSTKPIQSHTLFNVKLQKMAEPDKTQLFHHVLERLKEEVMLREDVLPNEADFSSATHR
ncbi:TPA: hypothetical protein MEY89_002748 [Klebsiella pneumoniae]|nr:hypothetical protein [Klebsiella pneumoniae]